MSTPFQTIQTSDQEINRIQSNISSALNSSGFSIPSGLVFAFAGSTVPDGFLVCDGSVVQIAKYPALYSAIGTANGIGNGPGTFSLPDYRGRFLRGVSGSSGNDPDASSRTAMNSGGNSGNSVGSIQGDQFKSHSHGTQSYLVNSSGSIAMAGTDLGASSGTNTAGGSETRPINAYVTFIIKT